jgi:outer membrane protein assembly factor BamD (BamD/ComL family)
MAALDRGDNNQAATLFNAFVAAHPRDSRAEDALYLRVIALQRTGNAAATERAASDYLRRYPRGFRKAEIESLAGKR